MEDMTYKKIGLWIYFSPLILIVGGWIFGFLIINHADCTLTGNLAFGDDYYEKCMLYGIDFAHWLNQRNGTSFVGAIFIVPWMLFGGLIIWILNVIEGRKK